jgi:RNA polymerase sigma-70 factor (ECF subfamily)
LHQRLAATFEDGTLARAVAPGVRPAPELDRAEAEAELCRRFAPRIRLYGLRHLRDPHAAADLVQQVLMTTLERLRAGEIREPERIASFVLGTCRMTVLETRRGAARRERLLETWAVVEEAAEAAEPRPLDEARLARCLEALAERERSVVLLAFVGDKSAEETGAELGLAAGNVRVIRHRALARLRACMEGK